MGQIITKQRPFTFKSQWEGVRNSELILNWKPIIDQFQLTGNFLLIHWQARPKHYRRWGFYYSGHDHYYTCDYDQLIFQDLVMVELLQISETKWNTTPVAPVLIKNVVVEYQPGLQSYLVRRLKND